MQQESVGLTKFMKRFQTKEQCEELLFKLRWPDGFICPKCGNTGFFRSKRGGLYGCSKCGHQVSAKSNTIFHKSHVQLDKWFIAIFMVMHDKTRVSSTRLSRVVNVSQPTAWLMLHKIKKAMAGLDSSYMLSRIAETDNAHSQVSASCFLLSSNESFQASGESSSPA
jgi:predicted RNA-binding Zn-ribbon protein involved in translation (DUF1610 family)